MLFKENEKLLWSGKPHVKKRSLVDNLLVNKKKLYTFTLLISLILSLSYILIFILILFFVFLSAGSSIESIINILLPMPDLLIGFFIIAFITYIFIFNLRARRFKEKERRKLKRIEYFITNQRILTILSYPYELQDRFFNNDEKCNLTNILISSIEYYSFESIDGSMPSIFNLITKTFPLKREDHENHLLKVKIIKNPESNEKDHIKIAKETGWVSENTIVIIRYMNLLEKQKNEIMEILNNLLPGKYKEIPFDKKK